jgi:zinc transporter, ZIP family
MIEAFFWAALAASTLLLGALVSYLFAPGRRVIAVVMALGTGLLIGSVSFELVDEALKTRTVGWVSLVVLVGAMVFSLGDWLLDRRGASDRKDPTGKQADGSPLAIVLGSILDGIPESFVLGFTVLQGGVSVALFAGVALSNFPEGCRRRAVSRRQAGRGAASCSCGSPSLPSRPSPLRRVTPS